MYDYIENLRTKPEHIKKRFAFITSSIITLAIFFVWIVSTYGLNTSNIKMADKDSDGKVLAEAPVSSLTASVVGAWDDIKTLFWGSNKAEFSAENTLNVEVVGGSR
jgi:hypothetical protein